MARTMKMRRKKKAKKGKKAKASKATTGKEKQVQSVDIPRKGNILGHHYNSTYFSIYVCVCYKAFINK